MKLSHSAALACSFFVLAGPSGFGANDKDDAVVTAVFSTVYNGYKRTKGADGKFKPETYAFGNGGVKNEGMRDQTIDDLPFLRVAEIVAKPLADRGYFPAKNPNETDLLIMVYYGRTAGTDRGSGSLAHQNLSDVMGQVHLESLAPPPPPPEGPGAGGSVDPVGPPQSAAESQLDGLLALVGMENRHRDNLNYRNARLLGYYDELVRTDTVAQYVGGGTYRRDLLADVEEDRYFVILVACDFRVANKEKKIRPLWSTRYNISARGRNFEKALPAMSTFASRHFGQPTGGLLRESIPLGEVEIKDLINLGEVKDEKK